MVSEAVLCDEFIEIAEDEGWAAFPEVAGWDIVLVWRGPSVDLSPDLTIREGDQFAIEAKTSCRVKALAQCLDRINRSPRPDFVGVLVPSISDDYKRVARALGISMFGLDLLSPVIKDRPLKQFMRQIVPRAGRTDGNKRLWLPPIAGNVQAGSSSPSPLSKWRVQALKICAILRDRGYLMTADFRAAGIGISTWRDKWIERDGNVEGTRYAKYVGKFDSSSFPDKGWEDERDEIVELCGLDTVKGFEDGDKESEEG